jgi:hypothetical protein
VVDVLGMDERREFIEPVFVNDALVIPANQLLIRIRPA